MDMDLLEMLASGLMNPGTLGKVGSKVQAKPDQVMQMAQLALPTLLTAMSRNASTPEGAESLSKALDRHADDKVDDFDSFFDTVDTDDGAKILNHVFSGKAQKVQSGIARNTGLDASQVAGLLTQFAPLLLGLLGQQKRQGNVGTEGLPDLLSSLSGSAGRLAGGNMAGLATRLLDSDGDGDIMDDIGGFFGSLGRK